MSAVAASLLDQPEVRFPLDLSVRIPKIRELYRSAIKNQWDPQTAIEWDQLDLRPFTQKQLEAARLYWSRRAWG